MIERIRTPNRLYGSFKSIFGIGNSGFDISQSIFGRDMFGKELFGKNLGIKAYDNYELMLAETTLINQVLKANGHCDKINYQYAIDVLRREYGLNHRDIKELFLIANDPLEKRPTIKQCADIVRNRFGRKKLSVLLEGLWLVAIANGKIDVSERSSITKIARAVGMNDQQNRNAQLGATRRSRVMQAASL